MDQQPKLLDRVSAALRARHYSRRTEEPYVGWIRRFILFHNKRHRAAETTIRWADANLIRNLHHHPHQTCDHLAVRH